MKHIFIVLCKEKHELTGKFRFLGLAFTATFGNFMTIKCLGCLVATLTLPKVLLEISETILIIYPTAIETHGA